MIYRLILMLAGMATFWPSDVVHSQTTPYASDDDGGVHLVEQREGGRFDESGNAVRGGSFSTGWVNVLGFELRGRTGPFQFQTGDSTGALWCTGGTERFADARIDLPHAAEIQYFRMWGFDNSADHNLTAFLRESCLPDLGAGAPVNTILAELNSSGIPGTFTETINLTLDPPVTNTRLCNYYVRVRFAPECADGGQLTMRKLRVQYRLAQ
jgi:hypothetical protein